MAGSRSGQKARGTFTSVMGLLQGGLETRDKEVAFLQKGLSRYVLFALFYLFCLFNSFRLVVLFFFKKLWVVGVREARKSLRVSPSDSSPYYLTYGS